MARLWSRCPEQRSQPRPSAARAPPVLAAPRCTSLLIVLSPGIEGLDGSLRDWSEVLLQIELSIRIPTRAGRESGASARWR